MQRIKMEPFRKPRMTRQDKWKHRPVVTKYWAAANELKLRYKGKLGDEIMLEFHISMPKSWSKKKKLEMNGKPHQQTPDIDNLVKAILDSLCPNGDQYVHTVVASKQWSEEGWIIIDNIHSYKTLT